MVAIDMHRYYGVVENLLERVERTMGVEPPPSPNWHNDLLWGATRPLAEARPAILREETARALEPLLAFRHFFRHAYTVELDPVGGQTKSSSGATSALNATAAIHANCFIESLLNMQRLHVASCRGSMATSSMADEDSFGPGRAGREWYESPSVPDGDGPSRSD